MVFKPNQEAAIKQFRKRFSTEPAVSGEGIEGERKKPVLTAEQERLLRERSRQISKICDWHFLPCGTTLF